VKWAPQEIETLKQYYMETPYNVFNLQELSKSMGRSEDALTLKAGKLGITNSHRKASIMSKQNESASQRVWSRTPEARQKRSLVSRHFLKNNPHPRGFTGHKHSESAKAVLRSKIMRRWQDPLDPFNSRAYRQYLSDRFTGVHKGGYSRSAGKRRPDLDSRYFRSKWEANVARYLTYLLQLKEIKAWEYEPDTFYFEAIKRGTRSYTPDFKIFENSGRIYYLEVKGWMDDRSKVKLSRMRKYYPNIEIDLMDETRYRNLAKQLKPLIPNWE